jgi:type IV pilus assembly protein PilM
MALFDFKKIFAKHGSTALGVDIGSSSLKVVELKKEGGRAVLKAYGEIALGPYAGANVGAISNLSNTKIAEALRDVLREAAINTKESGVAIPFKSSLVSLIEMPALPDKKLEEIIPIEARKYIPVPISEVTLDWWIVPKEKYDHVELARKAAEEKKDGVLATPRVTEKTDVLVISIHNEILSNYNNIIKDNDLETSFFEIEMFSASRALVVRSDAPTIIFDMGALSTKLYIVEKGIIRASHIINRASQDITQSLSKALGIDFAEAEKVKRNMTSLKEADQKTVADIVDLTLDYIWSETRTIIGNFERKYGKHISEIILTGGGVSLPGFKEAAEKELNIKAELGNPFGKVITPSFISAALRDTGHEFAVATGAALRKLEELS